MKRISVVISAAIVAFASQAVAECEKVEYPSIESAVSVANLFDNIPDKPITLTASLCLPEGDGPFPVVLWKHGAGNPHNRSYDSWNSDLEKELNKKRIALFHIDGYTARQIQKDVGRDLGMMGEATRLADTIGAFKFLAKHPKIDAKNIGMSGRSYGGVITNATTYEAWMKKLLPDGSRFAAHVAFYPSCYTIFRNYKSTGAPILFLLAEKDSYWSDLCVGLAKEMKASGANLEVVIYPNTYHAWIKDAPVKFHPNSQTFGNCAYLYWTADGHTEWRDKSTRGLKSYRQFFQYLVDSGCISRGAHTGNNSDKVRNDSLKRTVAFFDKHLRN